MCLIIHRPAGTKIPPALIDNALANNPDGWGIMSRSLVGNPRVRVVKGMDAESFLPVLQAFGDAELTIHCRVRTHGETDLANAHPFPFHRAKYALMHNGILPIPARIKRHSDTWHLAHDVVAPILARRPEAFGTDYLEGLLSGLIGPGNKLVILRHDGASMIVNRDKGVDYQGLWLSNSYSIPRVQTALPALAGSLWASRWRKADWDISPWYERDLDNEPGGSTPVDIMADRFETTLRDLAGLSFDRLSETCEKCPDYVAELILRAYDARETEDDRDTLVDDYLS